MPYPEVSMGCPNALNNFAVDYILLLNNDPVVDSNFLSEMIKVADNDRGIGITGSKIYYYNNPNQLQFVWGKVDFWRGRVTQTPKVLSGEIKRLELDKDQYDHIAEADWVTGCCFFG